jgi:hypothetical protein
MVLLTNSLPDTLLAGDFGDEPTLILTPSMPA